MNISIPFRPKLLDALRNYSGAQFRSDFGAGLNVVTLAFPLSMAFAIASGVKPEQGLFTAIIGGGLIAALGGSRVQIGGPTGAFVIITYSILQGFGLNGLFLCTIMAGAMLCLMGFAKMGSIIRFIPYPVSRAFTKGIAILILSSQIKYFFGLPVDKLPVDFVGKIKVLAQNLTAVHMPTVIFSVASVALIGLWPKRFSRFVPGALVGLIVATVAVAAFGMHERWQIATIGSEFGAFSSALPSLHVPMADWATFKELIQPAFTIALLVAMQALLGAVVTDGLIDDRHDSNQELVGQGVANMVGPLFGCIPVTGAVARSVVNVRSGARTPVAGLVHSVLLLVLVVTAAPLMSHIPLAVLSAILVVAAYRMVSWKQFARLTSWPFSDSSVFLATIALTVLTNLTLAVEVGVVLAALLMVKRISETSKITAVDETTDTEGSHHSLVGKDLPEGVLVFRVFGAFFFGVVDKLDDELKRAKQEPEVLILRVRKVLAMDATGLQALEDLHVKLRSKGKHLILSAPHTQPLAVMENAGFIDRLGRENVCPHITAALARAREILKLPPVTEPPEPHETLFHERQAVDAARKELAESLARAERILSKLDRTAQESAVEKAMTSGPLLFVAALGMLTGILTGRIAPRVWLTANLVGAIAALAATFPVLAGGAEWEWRSSFSIGGEPLHLRLDAISALFIALLGVVGGAGTVYSREYWTDQAHPRSARAGRVWWSALMLSLAVVLLSSNGLHFLIAWEVFAVSSYFLITLDRQRNDVRAAGWLYLAASHAATLCLFAFFATLAARTGSWELGPMREHAELAPLFWLALFGFGVKAGIFPLHIWLPSAHANAPSHVSAIMSGVTIKLGIYGLVRFSGWLPVPIGAGWIVAALGVISAVLGVAFALGQHDLKRLLAYHSVENIGIILIGLGFALIAAENGNAVWGQLALAGGLLHVWNHGLFKSLLFLGAGSVLHATGTREMSRLGGLWRTMPWTAGLFALGAVAISGLPPLNGFVSEWLVYLGLFDAVNSSGRAALAAVPAVVLLAMTGALALACFIKVCGVVFLGTPRSPAAERAHECGPLMRGPMLLLASACVAIGLAPILFWPAVARAASEWNPAWSGFAAPASLTTLGSAHIGVALLAVVAAAFLWRRTRQTGVRRALTWDCGYVAPTARMQYTAGSFAATITEWFEWILRPERHEQRAEKTFPVHATFAQHTPETVLEHVIEPAGGVVMRISNAARRLQHGRLQSYLLYLLAGLAALSAVVMAGK